MVDFEYIIRENVKIVVLTWMKKFGETKGVKIQDVVVVLNFRKKSGKTKEDSNFDCLRFPGLISKSEKAFHT